MSLSHRLFQTAKQFIPGGVNSPVRAFRNVDGEPFFVRRAEGQPHLGRGRARDDRLRRDLGAGDPRPCSGCGHRGGAHRCQGRTELWHSEPARSRTGADDLRVGAVGRKGSAGEQRDRGHDERHAARPRIHRARSHRQVRRMLSRARRFTARRGGSRRADTRAARQRRACRRHSPN